MLYVFFLFEQMGSDRELPTDVKCIVASYYVIIGEALRRAQQVVTNRARGYIPWPFQLSQQQLLAWYNDSAQLHFERVYRSTVTMKTASDDDGPLISRRTMKPPDDTLHGVNVVLGDEIVYSFRVVDKTIIM